MKSFLLSGFLNIWENINKCPSEAINQAANANGVCETPGPVQLVILITNLVKVALTLVGTVALLFLIIGGFYYITSAGNPDNVGKAKQTILYSIIGLILAIVSYAIINFIINQIQ